MTIHEQVSAVENLVREIYKQNDGPRLLAEMMEEFPNPRGVLFTPTDRLTPDRVAGDARLAYQR